MLVVRRYAGFKGKEEGWGGLETAGGWGGGLVGGLASEGRGAKYKILYFRRWVSGGMPKYCFTCYINFVDCNYGFHHARLYMSHMYIHRADKT